MLAVFTEEQQMLDDAVKKFAGDFGLNSPADLKAIDREQGWNALAAMGLAGLRIRDVDGVPHASAVEIAIAANALGARLVPLPLLGTAVFSLELLALANAPQGRLQALAEGRERICVLLAAGLGEAAAAQEEAAYAWDCAGAEMGLTITADGAGFVVGLHEISSATDCNAADLTRTVSKIEFGPAIEQYPLSAEAMDRWLAFVLTVTAADMVGAMRGALDGVVEYSKVRVQFKVPIGSFQAVQHICSEALTKITGAASTVNYAAWGVDELRGAESLQAARTAKAYTTSVGRLVCESVMQVYGGLGQTWESIAHLYLRRVMLSAQVMGGLQQLLERIADARLGVK